MEGGIVQGSVQTQICSQPNAAALEMGFVPEWLEVCPQEEAERAVIPENMARDDP